jgi:LPXTG-motif cell wall-anchored protein
MNSEYDAIIAEAAARYDVPESWIKAVIGVESDFNAAAYRAEPAINDASYGLMQLLYRTAALLGYDGDPEGLFDPETNIMLGAKYLGQLRSQFGDDFRAVYSAYNSGSADKYKTSSVVAQHVSNAMAWLQKFEESSFGAGALIAIIALGGLFFIKRRKHVQTTA